MHEKGKEGKGKEVRRQRGNKMGKSRETAKDNKRNAKRGKERRGNKAA